jgi:hypothetical protein
LPLASNLRKNVEGDEGAQLLSIQSVMTTDETGPVMIAASVSQSFVVIPNPHSLTDSRTLLGLCTHWGGRRFHLIDRGE